MIASFAFVIGVVAVATAEDWPEFRGPTGQGLVPGGPWPTVWSATNAVVWKQPIEGKGWSSPIVYKGRLYLTTAVSIGGDPIDHSLRAVALDAQTGQLLWTTEVFRQAGKTAAKIHSKNGHASPTPICDGTRLYLHFGHQGTAALDLNGKILWQLTDLKYIPVYGNGGSPALVADMLVFSCDGEDQQFLIALDKATGTTRWRMDRKCDLENKQAFSTPLLIEVAGQQQIISPAAGAIIAYEPVTGREVWRVRAPPDGYSNVPRPLSGHGLVFVSDSADKPRLLAIRPDGRGDVTDTHVAWTDTSALGLTASPVLVGEELYVISDRGVGTCLDAKTGKIHWRQRIGGDYSASLLHAAGHIYFQNEDGVAAVVKASKKFELVSKNDLGEAVLASYAAADGAFFIRGERHLFRIGSR
ncbi:PQQ-binding-like beta-propeller repeat protein [Anatilimnocola aggregata]|uniref:PQQ-binding-like beta-propeller repeat protein n=1 Tax=Anatilimnocola aggregata TaxID=2528021 RepID=UPI001EE4D494|nr:PQQ-binding-like beta-propeller repeat protein [Anatilimnocola aggregata]